MTINFKNTALASAIIAILMSSSAMATGTGQVSQAHGDQIRTVLSEQGYQVTKIEMDDGLYEAYASKDGVRFEIYLDTDFKIVKTELDD